MATFPDLPSELLAALDRVAITVRRPASGAYAGSAPSHVRGRALEFADYRPYTAGDDPRLVDWRAFARLDRLYLKQYEEERARTVTLLVDVSASLDWGTRDAHKGRYARRLAAALAWVALGHLEPVRVFLLRAGVATPQPGVRSRAHVGSLFERLSAVREAGGTDLAMAVRSALGQGHARGPTILLSDMLDGAWAAAIEALGSTGEAAIIQVLTADEWQPPLGEEVELQDIETGELRATRFGPSELATYRDRLAALQADMREGCQRRGALYTSLSTATPLQDALLRDLTRDGVLG